MRTHLPEPNEAHCLSILQSLVRIKSYSQTQGEIEATNRMCDLMQDLGLEAECVKFDGGKRQNAVGRWKGTGKAGEGKRLLFNGHLDTNPVTEGWTVDPWGGLIKDDMIYGIGVSNMSERDLQYSTILLTMPGRIRVLCLLLCGRNSPSIRLEAKIRRHPHVCRWRAAARRGHGKSHQTGKVRL